MASSSAEVRRVGALLVGLVAAPIAVVFTQAPQPTFKTTADLLVVETQVVDADGRPLPNLGPSDFRVKVGGRERAVASATLVRYTSGTEGLTSPSASEALSALTPEVRPAGRIFVIAVDEYSFRDNQLLPQLQETRSWLDRLQPEDQVALYGFPTGRTLVNLTQDRDVIRRALAPDLAGYPVPRGNFNLSASEIIDLTAGDSQVHSTVMARECSAMDRACGTAITAEAKALATEHQVRADKSLQSLRDLFRSLAPLPGRKTVILLSGGMLDADRVGGRPSINRRASEAGRDAALANATLYVIHRDDHLQDGMSATRGRGARALNVRDTSQMRAGLEFLAGAANGHLINVSAGTSDDAFSRVLRETSAYYILGVDIAPADRDGKTHFIEVRVPGLKASVRHRTTMLIPKPR